MDNCGALMRCERVYLSPPENGASDRDYEIVEERARERGCSIEKEVDRDGATTVEVCEAEFLPELNDDGNLVCSKCGYIEIMEDLVEAYVEDYDPADFMDLD